MLLNLKYNAKKKGAQQDAMDIKHLAVGAFSYLFHFFVAINGPGSPVASR